MLIGGLQKLTLLDYPGKIACTVFTVGCNFRCGFCHNPELVNLETESQFGGSNSKLISEEYFFEFLEENIGQIDGVCITGGEPTIQGNLMDFIKEIKKRGFFVKLDSNGTNPETLKKLFEEKLVDYVAMDVKGPIEKYQEIVGREIDLEKIKQSVELIKNSGVDYEFRTTIVPGLHVIEDMVRVGEWLNGAKKYYLQQFRAQITLDKKFENVVPFSDEEMMEFKDAVKSYVELCELRLI